MTLSGIYTAAIVLSVVAVLFIVAASVFRTTVDLPEAAEHFEATVVSVKDGHAAISDPPVPVLGEKRVRPALLFMAVFMCSAAMAAMLLYAYYNHMALRHGAFGDYRDVETVASVRDRSAHTYVDQSGSLPGDLSGAIVIFYKYTCNDCYDTHDQLVAVLEREYVTNVYFVSSRSARGMEMIEPFGVEAVPWGAYVSRQTGEVLYSTILYEEFQDEPDQKFIEENLMRLITAQKKGE